MAQALTRPLTRRVPSLLTRPLPNRLNPNEYHDGISLDFRRNQFYVKAPGRPAQVAPFTSLFTFTGDNRSMYRGASGLLIPSQTNTPRVEYDANGDCLGLLIEGARTNLILHSQDIGNAAYDVKYQGAATTNTTTAPDGTATADTWTENTATDTHAVGQSVAKAASNLTYSGSFWVKANGRSRIRLTLAGSTAGTNGVFGDYILTGNGSVTGLSTVGTGWSSPSGTIQAFANGWYRCTITGTSGTETSVVLIINLHNGTSTSYTGDNASGVHVWGAQLEQAAFPSSYIPTTTGSVTRSAEIAQRVYGAEFDITKGTAYVEYDFPIVNMGSTRQLLSRNTGGGATGGILWSGDGIPITINDSINQASDANPAPAINTLYKGATSYDVANGLVAVVSGTAATTNATFSGDMGGSGTIITVGSSTTGSHGFGHIRRLDYWPERLSNDNLQRLTA